jgi:hypothetical protein
LSLFVSDWSIYTGNGGVAFAFFRLWQRNGAEKYLDEAERFSKEAFELVSKDIRIKTK